VKTLSPAVAKLLWQICDSEVPEVSVLKSTRDEVCRPCLKCGYCCTKAACPFGEWDVVRGRCKFLTAGNLCGCYQEIIKRPHQALADLAPAFGAGCCMPLFDTWREAKRRAQPILKKYVDSGLVNVHNASMKADKRAFQPPKRPYKRHSLAAVNAVQGKYAYLAKARKLRAKLGVRL